MAKSKTTVASRLMGATGPVVIFSSIVVFVLIVGAVSTILFFQNEALQADYDRVSALREEYNKRIETLKLNLEVEIEEIKNVPTVVTKRVCSYNGTLSDILGNPRTCKNENRIENVPTKVVTKTTDPQVQKEIDETFAKLVSLSQPVERQQAFSDLVTDLRDLLNVIMKPLVGFVVLVASLYVILSRRYNSDAQRWAFGAAGTVLGMWIA